mgnify:CR=1 FL=1|jgi:hypothetical protein
MSDGGPVILCAEMGRIADGLGKALAEMKKDGAYLKILKEFK